MTDPETPRHIEVKDGDKTVADAEVSQEPEGIARASLRAVPGHIAPGSRRNLVDAVMDLPEVQESSRLEAAVPLGDGESLERLRERADEVTTRPAGSSVLVDGKVPPGSGSAAASGAGGPRRGDEDSPQAGRGGGDRR
jgi:hypothetical protein